MTAAQFIVSPSREKINKIWYICNTNYVRLKASEGIGSLIK